ncbi:hAT family C-terminal dimerization region [Phytophthora infestans]|uniref:HAT family C-terminal dimerization region n=1 Tax=Phytophthora infestans TaxID=4787 RepID=A0A833TIB6_PHYIN|nr:hAT family C-terminal dimerization region [Phytophthora infestans]
MPSLAVYFHASQKATNRLDKIQREQYAVDEPFPLKRQPLRVVTDCPTLWSSARNMLARMVLFCYLRSTVGKKEFDRAPSLFEPGGKDWFAIKCLLAILDPIAATSELLGDQGYPTLALAYPCLRQIQRTLERGDWFDEEASRARNASYKNAVLDLMINVRLAFSGLFRKRFEKIPAEILRISYLDPRLTNMEGLSLEEAVCLESEYSAIMSTNSARERRIRTHCTAELYRYLDEVEDVTFDVDSLEWWRKRGSEFPNLTPLARKWLAFFSSAGNTVTAKRSSLDPSLVRDLRFIHDNFVYPGWKPAEKDTSIPKGMMLATFRGGGVLFLIVVLVILISIEKTDLDSAQ